MSESSKTERELVRVAIALGSNRGDRADFLNRAVASLRSHPQIQVKRLSDFLENPAVGGAPDQNDYLNAALVLDTDLNPFELLEFLQGIETENGRDRATEGLHGARTLDLDLLLYGQLELASAVLEVPHPRMLERSFVLEPLAEIAPELLHPISGNTMLDEARALISPGIARKVAHARPQAVNAESRVGDASP